MLRTPSVPVPGGAARRRVTAVVVGLMVAGLTVAGARPGGSLSAPSVAAAASGGGTSRGLAPPKTPAVPLCGVADIRGSSGDGLITPEEYASVPTPRPRPVISSGQIAGFTDSGGRLYVERSPGSLAEYTVGGHELDSYALPSRSRRGAPLTLGNANPTIITDPSGGIYLFMMQGYTYDLVKLDASGELQWTSPVGGVPNGLFAWHTPTSGWVAAVVGRQGAGGPSLLITPSGARVTGGVPVAGTGNGEFAAATPGGGLIDTDGQYVRVLTSSGSPVTSSPGAVPVFGSAGSGTSTTGQTPGAAFAFAGAGGVVEVGSTIYVADPGPSDEGHGIDLFTGAGVYEGAASTSALGGLSAGSPLDYDPASRSLVFVNGGGVASISLSALRDLVRDPAAATQDGFGDTLGIGAGVTTTATAGYFPADTSPAVTAAFDPWWQRFVDPLELRYRVADGPQLTGGRLPTPTVVPLDGAHGFRTSVPLSVPRGPGTYLVDADLVDTRMGATIGSTCLTYSVGMPGDGLDLSGLAPAANEGGPTPERGVQLAAELGTGDMREQLDLATLLPHCDASAPDRAQCGPGALQGWSDYDPATEQAAAEATSLGVHFEVQFGQDNPVDEALVSSGLWPADVAAILGHFATSAPDLRDVEAWNEPNTGPFTPASYVTTVLRPFDDAVKDANATDRSDLQVIGGTVLNMDVSGWWSGIAKAGGFSSMNIVGIHPYSGFNRSFEEEGTPVAIVQLKALMARYGAGDLPIWVTEQGWWSDGEEDFYDVGNWAPRQWMWLRALGVSTWDYFVTEGQFSGFSTDFSLIDAADGDYFVKPGAIGLMTVSTLLGHRPFLRQVDLGIPHAYGMLFGPRSTSGAANDVLAVWTDDLDVEGTVSVASGPGHITVATTSAQGAPGSLTLSPTARLPLSGAPTYLTIPAGSTVSVGPSVPFGRNLALAASGATATASSSQSAENAASDVIRGSATADNGLGLSSTPVWAAGPDDRSPRITVHLKAPRTIDRVLVSTSTIGSVLPGLRAYSVQLDVAGRWTTVASVDNQYFNRMMLFTFPAVADVSALRIAIRSVDYGSIVGGAVPYFWDPGTTSYDFPTVYSLEAYGPSPPVGR